MIDIVLVKFWTKIILLGVIDYALIWGWVKYLNPDPSVSVLSLFLVPFVVIINLIIAVAFYFFKSKNFALFVINSMISGFLMSYLFSEGIDRYQNERLESWEFKLNGITYHIIHWKTDRTFTMSKSKQAGSSTQFLEGIFSRYENGYSLTTDSTEFRIRNNYLYQFRNPADSILLTKVER